MQAEIAGGIFCLPTKHAIADSGATQIFAMDGTPVINKRPTTNPLRVALADGRQVRTTHMCDIKIEGLPVTLMGHIIPDLSIASLFGIRVLTEAGCNVMFTKGDCVVKYSENIILQGEKKPATDLWTLLLGSQGMTSQRDMSMLPSQPLTMPMPMPTPHYKLRLLPTLSAQGQIAFTLHISRYAVPESPHYSKQSSEGTSKGAPI